MASSGCCPLPDRLTDTVEMAHGGGGRMTAELIAGVFAPAFSNDFLNRRHDAALLPEPDCRLAMTTDTFVVTPLFFPGGSIGDLAVNGTVNDLLCAGATPRYLSCGFVIEEGFPMESLRRVVADMAEAARLAEVEIVTGDTKVVERGRCDGVYINTSGIGYVPHGLDIDPGALAPGDVIICSGPVGCHGMAVMSVREGLEFSSPIKSDTASLGDIVHNLLDVVAAPKVLRDPTRGGLSSTLNELAETSGVDIELDEEAIPVDPEVRSACELLGLDPLYVANEGLMLIAVSADEAERALAAVRRSAHGSRAAIIGRVQPTAPGRAPAVWLRMPLGQRRRLEMLSGEQLPRIC
ncbi:MAG: hydrogenase expression/formation protein HypE [Bacteroides sp.]|nr:hydrogenase expression/formation protein HypE [Bacteroidales bacterium]MBD5316916.1 hydrogenase expression/formation protein HypE [Bacteroides sp.]MBD5378112.1 hydrogenase expression/formation protein HypE [Bacteroides sp.]